MTVILQYEYGDTYKQVLAVMTLAAGLKAAKSAVRCALQYFESIDIQRQGMMGKRNLSL